MWLLPYAGPVTPEAILFYGFAVLALVFGGLLVTQRNPARAAVSFAVDPQRQSAQAAVMAAQRSLSAGTRLTIVQVVKPPPHEYHALRVPLL